MVTPMLEKSAITYAQRFGWQVFPLLAGDKRPLTDHGVLDATTDLAKIHRWWARWPGANIAVACGPSHLLVVDCDVKNGTDGILVWNELKAEHNFDDDTIIQLTPSGGQHIVYTVDPNLRIRNSAGKLGPGVDIRGDGGYIVVAPSVLADGKQYAWDVGNHPGSKAVAAAPARLVALLSEPPEALRKAAPVENQIFTGQRNDVLTSLAGTMRRRGMQEDEILVALTAVNENRCAPPLRLDEIERIAHNVAHYAPVAAPVSGQQFFPTTDLGNAERFAVSHGSTLRYCHAWGKWLYWSSGRWSVDESDEVVRRGKETARDIEQEASAARTSGEQDATIKWARSSESRAKLTAMVELAQAEPAIGIRPENLDADPWALNVKNGMIDLRTGYLQEPQPEHLMTKQVRVAYEPDATCPRWLAFLDRIMAGNADLIGFLQRAVGYSLTGSTREQCMFILYGAGANGKSVFLETVAGILHDYACRTPTETLLMKRGDSIPNDVARLKGARLVTAIETDQGRRMAESMVKQMTGGERLTARFLHREWFEFAPEFKIFLGTNHKPEIVGTDYAIWRRIRLIPFAVTIPIAEQDRDLAADLRAEWPGILAWAVQGCLLWQLVGLEPPAEVVKATGGYRAEMDTLAGFLDECCVQRVDLTVPVGDLYKRYVAWCVECTERPLPKKMLSLRMEERGYTQRHTNAGRTWLGLGLLGEAAQQTMGPEMAF
jgi:putative DNA primase/helicase